MEQKQKNTYTKDGRKPISTRSRAAETISYDDVFANALSVDPELQKELDAKGLVPRFVDAKRMAEFGGYNDKGWEIYRRDKKISDTMNPSDFKFGNDPSGIIRRGSLVLAVKTKDKAAMHRKFLDQRASQSKKFADKQADELRAFAKQNGLNAEIHEGYEDNEAPGI